MAKKKKKKNAQLGAALTVAGIIHAVVLVAVGGYTVYKYVQPTEPKFEAPPPMKPLEPRKLEYKMKTQDRQKQSAKPRQRRIEVKSLNSVNLPNIQISAPNIGAAVDVGVGVADIGVGSFSGSGLRMGVSAVDFFGVKSKGERIVIIVDIARSMLDPERGDIPGFMRVKREVGEVIQGLNSATLFNLMVFARGVDVMSESLVVATEANKQRAIDFFKPYWDADGGFITGQRGVYLRNYYPDLGDVPVLGAAEKNVRVGGGSRMDLALLASFEQKADAVFMITDGTPSITRDLMGNEIRDYEKALAEFEKGKAKFSDKEIEKYEKELAEWNKKDKKFRERQKEERATKGLGEVISGGGSRAKGLPKPPWGNGPKAWKRIEGDDFFVNWMEERAEAIYGGRSKRPTLNIIGYSVDEDVERFLKSLQRPFPSSVYRTIGDPKKGNDDV